MTHIDCNIMLNQVKQNISVRRRDQILNWTKNWSVFSNDKVHTFFNSFSYCIFTNIQGNHDLLNFLVQTANLQTNHITFHGKLLWTKGFISLDKFTS